MNFETYIGTGSAFAALFFQLHTVFRILILNQFFKVLKLKSNLAKYPYVPIHILLVFRALSFQLPFFELSNGTKKFSNIVIFLLLSLLKPVHTRYDFSSSTFLLTIEKSTIFAQSY